MRPVVGAPPPSVRGVPASLNSVLSALNSVHRAALNCRSVGPWVASSPFSSLAVVKQEEEERMED